MKRIAVLATVLLATFLLAGCKPDPRNPATIAAGNDLFNATASLRVEITTNEIPGVTPFTGPISMIAEPFGSRGAFQLGDTNVAITRFENVTEPGTDAVAVEATLGEMAFISDQPLTLTIGGTPEDFTVRAWAAADEDQGQGSVSLTETFYTLDLPLTLHVELTSINRTVTLPPQTDTWTAGLGYRVPLSECNTPDLAANGFPITLCARDVEGFTTGSLFNTITLQPASDNGVVAGTPPTISPSAAIDATALVGPGTSIADNVTVAAGAVIGEAVTIGIGSTIGENVVLVDGVTLGSNVTIGADSVVDFQSLVAPDAFVGTDVKIGSFGDIQIGATVGDGATLGNFVSVEAGASVAANIVLAGDAIIAASTVQSESIFRCELETGEIILTTGLDCVDNLFGQPSCMTPRPAAIIDDIKKAFGPQTKSQNIPADILASLTAAIDAADVGGPDRRKEYDADTNDCDDYADRLEKALTAAGFDATLTVIYTYELRPGPGWFWDGLDLPKMDIVSAHAITDVHLDDGSTIWIEPQAGMSNETGTKNALNVDTVCLDDDGDGTVETADGPGKGPTDGLKRVEVYPDRETAEKKGVEFD